MDIAAVRAAFDEQMRRRPPAEPGGRIELGARVTRVLAEGGGWNGVVWSDLSDGDADEAIAAEIERFAAANRSWEWKYYSHDRPVDLPEKLLHAGFAPDPVEAVLVAEVADLPLIPVLPPGVELAPVTDQAGAAALVRVHDDVFGGDHGAIGRAVLAGLASDLPSVAAVIAIAAGRPVSAGRVEFPNGADFATIWGGGTVPAWRRRGIFRSLVAHRAALARQRGYRYLQVDASAESRPILLQLGFVELAKTIPFRYDPSTAP